MGPRFRADDTDWVSKFIRVARWSSRIALAAASALLPTAVHAVDFYQGKQITITVGFTSGGTYDATARLFARHLGRHLADNPTVVVRNMPGSGSLVAAMHLYNAAPRDGTALGIIGGGTVLEPLLGNPQARYDAQRFTWIGGRSRDNFLCAVWHTVPVATMADVTRRETVVGATGPGSRTMSYPKALNELIGTNSRSCPAIPAATRSRLRSNAARSRLLRVGARQHHDARARVAARRQDQAIGAVHGRQARSGERAARERARADGGRQAGDRRARRRLSAGLAAARAARPARRAHARAAGGLRCNDDGPRAIGGGRAVGPRHRRGGTEMQTLVEHLYATPPAVLDLVRKINAGR
jgi:hypothetical protein